MVFKEYHDVISEGIPGGKKAIVEHDWSHHITPQDCDDSAYHVFSLISSATDNDHIIFANWKALIGSNISPETRFSNSAANA